MAHPPHARHGACATAIASLIHAGGLVSLGVLIGVLLARPCAWQAMQASATAALVSLASGIAADVGAAPYAGAPPSLAPRQARSDAPDDTTHVPDRSVLRDTASNAPVLDTVDGCGGISAPLSGSADVSSSFAGTLMRMRSRCPR